MKTFWRAVYVSFFLSAMGWWVLWCCLGWLVGRLEDECVTVFERVVDFLDKRQQ